MNDNKILCAKIPTIQLPDADYCIIPVFAEHDGEDVHEFIRNEINAREGDEEYRDIQLLITFKEYDREYLKDIGLEIVAKESGGVEG